MIERFGDKFARVLEVLLALSLLFAMCLNFANVIGRYLVGVSIIGADEVQVFILVWIAFVGSAVVAWRGQHLRMDVLVQRIPRRSQLVLKSIELLVVGSLCTFAAVLSWLYTFRVFNFGQTSDLADIPMWIPHGSIVIGFALMSLILFWRFLSLLKSSFIRGSSAIAASE